MSIPDGDPQKVRAAFAALQRARQRAIEAEAAVVIQLRAWSVISTQKAIAGKLGITPQYFNDVLHGRRAVSANTIEQALEGKQ